MLKGPLPLDFAQIGLITLTFQLTASLLQPIVGIYTDRRPLPYSLAVRHGVRRCVGLLLLSVAGSFATMLLVAAADRHRLARSSIPSPRGSRGSPSGGRHGFAQSVFQVGGNIGSSLGPLLAAFFVLPHGQLEHRLVRARGLLGIVLLAAGRPLVRDASGAARGPAPAARPGRAGRRAAG